LSGSSAPPGDRPVPGPHTLVIRAVFVPDGEPPPPEMMSSFDSLRFRVSLNPATGELTCDEPGNGFDSGIQAQWYPDNNEDPFGGGENPFEPGGPNDTPPAETGDDSGL
jgi:hypothetical protein